MSAYQDFLARKATVDPPTGLRNDFELPAAMFPHQRDITAWALRRGRAAIFAGTGLGKIFMELAWADAVHAETGRDILHLAPMAVSAQLEREAAKFEVSGHRVRTQLDSHAAQTRSEGRDAWPYEQWASILVWQRYASPVWSDINQTRTLQYRGGRDEKDEQHISPLQLDVIERCIDLWSAKGDVVLTPFLGIGSEVFAAVEMGRRGVGFELKPSYFAQAKRNLSSVKKGGAVALGDLFTEAAE